MGQVAWLKAAALNVLFNRRNFLQARRFDEFSTLAHRTVEDFVWDTYGP